MPLFEYVCEDCGLIFSEFRSSAERDNPIDCPDCGGHDVHRKMSMFSSFGGDSTGSASCGPGAFT